MSQTAEQLIRTIPIRNLHGNLFPEARPKLQLPSLSIPETTTAKQHLLAWVEECDKVAQSVEQRQQNTKDFDAWYEDYYLRRQPPGIMETSVLSPSKRK